MEPSSSSSSSSSSSYRDNNGPTQFLENGGRIESFNEEFFTESPFKRPCHQFSMQKDDLDPFRQKLTPFDDAVKLSNDFEGQKARVENIREGILTQLNKSRSQKALEDKGWLTAAMVLGLMASYPLILQPTYHVAGDLLRRMRGITVPKVQG